MYIVFVRQVEHQMIPWSHWRGHEWYEEGSKVVDLKKKKAKKASKAPATKVVHVAKAATLGKNAQDAVARRK